MHRHAWMLGLSMLSVSNTMRGHLVLLRMLLVLLVHLHSAQSRAAGPESSTIWGSSTTGGSVAHLS